MTRNSIEFHTHRVREVHVDLNREALEQIAKNEEVDFVVIRVQVFSPNGRPASRTLRLSRDMLTEPEEDYATKPSFE